MQMKNYAENPQRIGFAKSATMSQRVIFSKGTEAKKALQRGRRFGKIGGTGDWGRDYRNEDERRPGSK